MKLTRIVALANMFDLKRAGTYYHRGCKVERVKFYGISSFANPYKLIAQVKREFPNVEVKRGFSLTFRFKVER